MAVRRLNHAVLYVNGLAREVEFYTKTLGFEVRMEVPGRAAFLRSPGSVNDHDLGLFDIGAGSRRTAARRSASTTWPGRSARSRSWSRPGSGWSTPAPWWARATTACRSPCTPRTRAASSSRSCGASPPEDWDAEMALDGGYTVPLDWDRTLSRWDPQRRPAPPPIPPPDPTGRERAQGCRNALGTLPSAGPWLAGPVVSRARG